MIRSVWLPVNQAWAVMWYDQVLRIFNSKQDADAYIETLMHS